MLRVAIYARYSNELQKATSIEDQLRICLERAAKEGWRVVETYTDFALTGSNLSARTGMKNLMRDGAAGMFDIAYAESLDRFSRDQEDIAGMYKRLQFSGVKIITQSEGEITPLHVGLKGTMNALFLKDLADKVRRGQRGRVEQGKAGGGNAFGYDVIKRFDASGEPVRGERAINGEEARIVRRIFDEFIAGRSPKVIAHRLNEDRIPGPAGKGWTASTINGNWQRGSGILNQELYIGCIAWNKVRYVKNPDTGKNVTRPNAPEEWVRKEVPELRIIEQEVWDRAKARQRRARIKTQFWDRQRPRYLLSGLLRCGQCRGGMSKISALSYGCSGARNQGDTACTNRRTVRRDDVERTVLHALQTSLMDPALIGEFCEAYTAQINKLRMEHNASLHRYKAELEKLNRQERRIVDAVKDGYANPTMKAESHQIVERREVLLDLLGRHVEAPAYIHPTMAKRYHQEVASLVEALNDDGRKAEAGDLIRSLVEAVVVLPDPESNGVLIDLHGDLAGILNIATQKEKMNADNELDVKHVQMVVGLDTTPAPTNRSKLRRGDLPPTTFTPLPRASKVVGPAGLEPATRPL